VTSRIRAIAAISGLYDLLVGAFLILGRDQLAGWFGVAPPVPPIHSDLNGLFLVAIGLGYLMPYRDPDLHRGYLWVMGPFLKGGGAVVFVLDYLIRHSPASFLLFAVSDGTLALLTAWALVTTRGTARLLDRRVAAGSSENTSGFLPR
jgi:hypothetical protein